MIKLKELKEVQGNINKKIYVKNNKDDKEFITCLRFLLDDFILTYITPIKLNKVINLVPNVFFNDIYEVLEYVKSGSGKNIEIVNLQNYINNLTNQDEKDILFGLITKTYQTNFGKTFFNECMPENPIFEMPYMGCIPFSEKKALELFKDNKKAISQIKNDGCFINMFIKDNEITFYGRSGLKFYINGPLVSECKKIRMKSNCELVLTGELMLEGYDRQTANGIIRSLIISNEKIANGDEKENEKFLNKYGKTISDFESLLYCVMWDSIPLSAFFKKKYEITYIERLRALESVITGCNKIKVTEYKIVNSYKEAMEHLQELLGNMEEGSVLKSLDGVWKDGKPNWQIKMKLEMELDLEIVGFNKGKAKGRFENTLGSLSVQSSCGTLKTDMAGLSDEDRDFFWKNQDLFLNKIVTIKCNGISRNRDGGISLLYPNYLYVRTDKKEANSYDEILEIQEMKLELGK